MTELTVTEDHLPTQFEPEQTHDKQAQLDAIIQLAQKTKNWDALESAVAMKIEEQQEFVRWWDKNVDKPGGDRTIISEREIMLSAAEAEKLTGFSSLRVSRMRKSLSNLKAYSEKLFGAAYKKAFPDETIADKMTGDEESYTPEQYLESARVVMGGIDLDPASNPMAQENVQADTYYTVDDDGLTQEWKGRMWMNPPYTARVINRFIEKAVDGYRNGDITQAIVLTNNNTDTSWFHIGAQAAAAICFTAGRINFLKRDGSTSSPTNGQLFFYFGNNGEEFRAEFSKYGLVMIKA
jgi:phage N-6-adenine-methyltransferase